MSTESVPASSKPVGSLETCTCVTPGPSTPRLRTRPTGLGSCGHRHSCASPRNPLAVSTEVTDTLRRGRWGLIARESQTCRAETDVHPPSTLRARVDRHPDGHGAPGSSSGDLLVEDDVLHLHRAERCDRVGDTPEQRGDVVLTLPRGVGETEVPDGPGRRSHSCAVLQSLVVRHFVSLVAHRGDVPACA